MKVFSPKIFGSSIFRSEADDSKKIKTTIIEFYLAKWDVGVIASWFNCSAPTVAEILLNENLPFTTQRGRVERLYRNQTLEKCTNCSRKFRTIIGKHFCSCDCIRAKYWGDKDYQLVYHPVATEEDIITIIKKYELPPIVEAVDE